jgi:hypothetical protein
MPRWEGEAMFVEKKVYAERKGEGLKLVLAWEGKIMESK